MTDTWSVLGDLSPVPALAPAPVTASKAFLLAQGLTEQWIETECQELLKSVQNLQKFLNDDDILATSIRNQIANQMQLMREQQNLSKTLESAQNLLLRDPDSIDWDSIQDVEAVMRFIPQISEEAWRVGMLNLSYNAHKRIRAIEENQSEDREAIEGLSTKQTQLEAVLAETRATATRTELLVCQNAFEGAHLAVAQAERNASEAKAKLAAVQQTRYYREHRKTQDVQKAQEDVRHCVYNLLCAQQRLSEAQNALENAEQSASQAQPGLDALTVPVMQTQFSLSF